MEFKQLLEPHLDFGSRKDFTKSKLDKIRTILHVHVLCMYWIIILTKLKPQKIEAKKIEAL